MKGFVILVDSRDEDNKVLALVNRKKYTNQWWTEMIEKSMVFVDEKSAYDQKRKLKFNNPRVVEYLEGKNILENQKLRV